MPEGAERMATMWSMIPDDRGPRRRTRRRGKPAAGRRRRGPEAGTPEDPGLGTAGT